MVHRDREWGSGLRDFGASGSLNSHERPTDACRHTHALLRACIHKKDRRLQSCRDPWPSRGCIPDYGR